MVARRAVSPQTLARTLAPPPSAGRFMTTKPLRSRCGVVLKGTWYFGYGARFDKAEPVDTRIARR